jgi:cytochrome c peroxidase
MSIPLNKTSCLIVSIITILFASVTRAGSLGISLQHTVIGKPIILDSLRYQTSAKETFSISRLSYLLSEFELQSTAGNWLALPNSVQWIDAKKHRTQILLDSIPKGDFKAIRFNLGLSEAVNHSDPNIYAAKHPLNPSLNNLHWNWQTGYIFLALEGTYRQPNGQLSGYVYHFANDPQRTTITLTLPKNITANTALDLDFDIATLLNAPTPISFLKDGASTHSREGDPIPHALKSNLPGAFQIKRIRTAARIEADAPPQPIDLPTAPTPYPFKLGSRLPIPSLPLDNPLIVERIELGRQLFHDPQLSIDNTIACASCHQQGHALSDPAPNSAGVNGQFSRRHSMPLFNMAWKDSFFWDGRAHSLREQALIPIEDPREMGESLDHVIEKLTADADYSTRFSNAFGSGAITAQNIGLAIENFLLSLTSYDSKFDQAMSGKTQLSTSEQRGFELFMTEFEPRSSQYGADCFHCHGGALLTDNRFHDNGLEATSDLGLAEVTQNPIDANRFSTPSLRNIALTAPYMHDGRFQTLEEVVEHYSSGITSRVTLDPNLAKHPTAGLQLSVQDKAALVDFLKTLSDPQFIQN